MAQAEKPNYVKSASVPALARCLKLINCLCAANLCAAGCLAFWFMTQDDDQGNSQFSVPTMLSAIYVIVFSLLLLFFELHWKSLDKSMFLLFGFMFSWYGRSIFFFFVGTLAFALFIPGYVAGGFTILTVILNIYALCYNQGYKEFIQKQGGDAKLAAEKSVLQDVVHSSPSPATTANAPASSAATSSGPAKSAQNPSGADWEKFRDDETGSNYFYNHVTKETRWENA